jgi:hypothetical protein
MEKLKKVDVELDQQTFLKIAIMAHEKDITFNQICSQILEEYMKNEGYEQ